jgi:hypothetical protein
MLSKAGVCEGSMSEPAGVIWCPRYPTSTLISDLIEPFRDNTLEFVSAIESDGGRVTMMATYRPPERAYLMHYCCMIVGLKCERMPPDAVPPMADVDIQWDLGDAATSIAAAAAMVKGYGIVFPAALVSRHTQHRAFDAEIVYRLTGQPLWDMGKSFGVIKLISDAPHWSDDGH